MKRLETCCCGLRSRLFFCSCRHHCSCTLGGMVREEDFVNSNAILAYEWQHVGLSLTLDSVLGCFRAA